MSNSMAINGYGYPYAQYAQYYQYPYMQTYATLENNQGGYQTQPVRMAAQPEKKSHAAGRILGAVAVVGAAVLCYKGYKAGSGKGIAKMWDGVKKITTGAFNGVKGKVDNLIHPDKFSIVGEGDKALCKIPGRTNIMRTADAVKGLEAIGESAAVPELTREALANGTLQLRNGTITDGNKVIKFVKGNIVEYTRGGVTIKGDSTKTLAQKLSKSEYNKLLDLVKQAQRGEGLEKLTDIVFSQKGNGVSRLFTAADSSTAATLKSAVADRFAHNSEAVKAFCVKNPAYKEAIEKFVAGDSSALKVVSGEYVIPDVGNLVCKNDKVIGIKIGDTLYGPESEKYLALYTDNKEAFEKVLGHKNDFINKVFQLE